MVTGDTITDVDTNVLGDTGAEKNCRTIFIIIIMCSTCVHLFNCIILNTTGDG
jgi:hypothetical protein